MPSEAEVEAGARALHVLLELEDGWESTLSQEDRDGYGVMARAALVAARTVAPTCTCGAVEYGDMVQHLTPCPLAPTPCEDVAEWSESDRRDVRVWLTREADQRVHLFPQRRDGVDALMRHLADSLYAPTPPADMVPATALADAWDAGYDLGDPYHRRGNPDEGKATNPYRTTPTDEQVMDAFGDAG